MGVVDWIYYINMFFFIYMFIYAVTYFLMTLFASFKLDDFYIRKEHMSESVISNENNHIPISILVPAYNEEVTIIDSIESLINLDYPQYEIVIVNDGSKDSTSERLIEYYDLKKVQRPYRRLVKSKDALEIYENQGNIKIILAEKENGGKSDALNLGINLSSYPLFLCVDADSVLQRDALKKIVEPFLEKDKTVAAGGNIRVSNGMIIEDGVIKSFEKPKNPTVLFQLIEYIRVFLNSRVSLNGINGNLIISGAFGLYRKQAVVNVGGYTHGLMGEDMEITVKIHSFYKKNNIPYRASYVPDAICWTQVPESLKILRRQRRRWQVGLGQSLKMHKYMFLNPKYGVIGMISFPYFVLFEYMSPFIEILGVATVIASFIFNVINVNFLILYLLVYIGYNIVISIISIIADSYILGIENNRGILGRLLFLSVLESFGYRQIMSLFKIGGMFNRKKNRKWGEMERVKYD